MSNYRSFALGLFIEVPFTSLWTSYSLPYQYPKWLDWVDDVMTAKRCSNVQSYVTQVLIVGALWGFSKLLSFLELYRACGSEKKRLARFPGGTHNETWLCPQYYHTIAYFLEEVRISCQDNCHQSFVGVLPGAKD